jgi:Flp pilus assembly protein TadG
MHRLRDKRGERGAAAVEFALVLPVLILLILGLLEFGRLYNVQISLANAAREGARTMVLTKNSAQARTAAIAAAPSVSPAIAAGQIVFSPAACATGVQMKVTVTYSATLMTGFFGTTLPLRGVGVMRCGG